MTIRRNLGVGLMLLQFIDINTFPPQFLVVCNFWPDLNTTVFIDAETKISKALPFFVVSLLSSLWSLLFNCYVQVFTFLRNVHLISKLLSWMFSFRRRIVCAIRKPTLLTLHIPIKRLKSCNFFTSLYPILSLELIHSSKNISDIFDQSLDHFIELNSDREMINAEECTI
jgi:hypothetical protein